MTDHSFAPDWYSRPGDTVCELIESRGLTVDQFIAQTGWEPATVRSLILGTLEIDEGIAATLAKELGGSARFWLRRQEDFQSGLAAAASRISAASAKEWLRKLPVKQMRDDGWLDAESDTASTLRSALSFFDVSAPDEWEERYTKFANEFLYRTSQTYESTTGALSAWLRQGERVLSASGGAAGAWDAAAFRSSLDDVRALTRSKSPESFIPKLQEVCSQRGVAVVFVKAPPGCRTSGASRFVSDTKAMMILSFRYLSDDHFWFSFFHEAAHLLLHGPGKTFVDGDIAAPTDEEREANAFSAGMLIPADRLEEMLGLRSQVNDIVRFAQAIGVSPGIVVGQMQHHRVLGPNQMASLKRRFSWEQISAAAA